MDSDPWLLHGLRLAHQLKLLPTEKGFSFFKIGALTLCLINLEDFFPQKMLISGKQKKKQKVVLNSLDKWLLLMLHLHIACTMATPESLGTPAHCPSLSMTTSVLRQLSTLKKDKN
jgi:hypothetical protein